MIITNIWVVLSTVDQIYKADELNGDRDTALILGTSYTTVEGNKNPFFYSRMNTAVSLYHENQVSSFILSGSATNYYNEPRAMASSLTESGIPKTSLRQDSLGVRTLASIIRCKEVYNQHNIIIITQRFHAYRALFISNFYGIDAVVVATEDVG